MAVEQASDREGLCVQSLTPVLHRQLAIVMRQDKILSKGISGIIRLLQKGCRNINGSSPVEGELTCDVFLEETN
jgi:hypothetical protein